MEELLPGKNFFICIFNEMFEAVEDQFWEAIYNNQCAASLGAADLREHHTLHPAQSPGWLSSKHTTNLPQHFLQLKNYKK